MTGTDDGFSLADTLGTVEAAYDRIDDREAAKEGLRALPEREREILYLRYFEDMSQARIGEKIGALPDARVPADRPELCAGPQPCAWCGRLAAAGALPGPATS